MLFLVTGASAGFGAEISRVLVSKGHSVIGTARRKEKLAQLQEELGDKFYPLCFDISSKEETKNAINSLPEHLQQIDVLVNNAGLGLGLEPAHSASFEDWEKMINTNVLGLCYVTHLILPKMVARKSGLIINMGSIAGTYPYPGGNVYGATKAFTKQFSLNLRADLAGTGVRVCNIEPGLCGETEFSHVRFKGDTEKVNALYNDVDFIQPIDIANIVSWVSEQPQHVNINAIEVMPTAQSFSALNVVKNN
ncbi:MULTISPECIES: SDR family oxidoreductase [Pasteurellaceae]|uniref:SDR family oxidoreductase n=1 Tax=Pasteurella atlantica TaxID=2827233 RepID=A0AAW8CPM7_9PAST|nr:SDR family oxidoreductase [Pasteurella atlantica]MBR0573623.1 SDR family oxidoreductase [Pasteurella atlantica]MDP8039378.1 SDR family oxidoreductase [Pasteurella atlantica]MDP8041470.1 SDR family oxidoreductase [Pasteurella atlantica]MDP8043605.1 SDR family oxidoreductase [Pasteurella atlantica]MDP8045691.1 SDR family oxidoreductase [Pasteurella atlantica]